MSSNNGQSFNCQEQDEFIEDSSGYTPQGEMEEEDEPSDNEPSDNEGIISQYNHSHKKILNLDRKVTSTSEATSGTVASNATDFIAETIPSVQNAKTKTTTIFNSEKDVTFQTKPGDGKNEPDKPESCFQKSQEHDLKTHAEKILTDSMEDGFTGKTVSADQLLNNTDNTINVTKEENIIKTITSEMSLPDESPSKKGASKRKNSSPKIHHSPKKTNNNNKKVSTPKKVRQTRSQRIKGSKNGIYFFCSCVNIIIMRY